MAGEQRQAVRFLFLKLDPMWRRLPAEQQINHKSELGRTVREFRARLLLRTYSLMGTRGDADLLFWQAAPGIETLQAFETAIFSTQLGSYLEIPTSYLSMTKQSIYEFPDEAAAAQRLTIQPADRKYLFVYPFVKKREWYRLTHDERQEMMTEHIRIGRKYPGVRVNTTYSFGLDDQEFVVTFECETPEEFLDLVMELRGSAASAYTERDTPVFTCIQMSIWDAMDSLGGRGAVARDSGHSVSDRGFVEVGVMDDLTEGTSRRVYLDTAAVALFNVRGRVYAVNDRCPHGRASLSEGVVDADTGTLTCPWHEGTFNLSNGHRLAGPPRTDVESFEVQVVDGRILIRRRAEGAVQTDAPMTVADASVDRQ